MPGWNFADTWETIAAKLPDAQAQVQGDQRFTWADFDRRANGVARFLLDAGAQEQDKVAQYLQNAPEYLESMFAAFKAGLAPINTNFRYADDELVYLWDNADCVAVVFHSTYTGTIERIRDRVPKVTTWLWVDDGDGLCPEWAMPYEEAADTPVDREAFRWWLTVATLRWGVICRFQAERHLSGQTPSVELAAIGRRVSETEWDVLDLLEGGAHVRSKND